MRLKQIVSHLRGTEPEDTLESRHIPLIVSPLQDLQDLQDGNATKIPSHDDSIADSWQQGDPIFKAHHEASPIELFYDLFFVANLATFTQYHEINTGSAFRSYLGFFSLLWATWLQTSLFDVRFTYDSVFLRVCKALHLGVQMGFVVSGAVFSTDPDTVDKSSFQTLAMMQMISRATLVIQYGAVFWYVKGYPKTAVPLLLTMGILFAASMVYLGTYFGFDDPTNKTYYAWYITAPIEIILCVIVSSIWRVLSFSKTHLVERVGLLTLIIMGEGIIGLSKSVSYLLRNATNVSARDVGVLITGVLLIYFIYMLYFDQIQNRRFGTIKQQVWALLHYPLHLCILFTVEGSRNLFNWSIIMPTYLAWRDKFPLITPPSALFQPFTDLPALIDYIEGALTSFSAGFRDEAKPYKYYDYNKNVTFLQNNITAPFGSQEWQNESLPLIIEMWQGVGNAIFEIYGVYAPEVKNVETGSAVAAAQNEFVSLINVFSVVFLYFYIAAGLFLVTLAMLYVVGNKRKTAGEWFAVGFRVFAGAGITMTLVGLRYTLTSVDGEAFKFYVSPWHAVIVMLIYLIVIVVDNLVVEVTLRRRRRRRHAVDTEKLQPPSSQFQASDQSTPTNEYDNPTSLGRGWQQSSDLHQAVMRASEDNVHIDRSRK